MSNDMSLQQKLDEALAYIKMQEYEMDLIIHQRYEAELSREYTRGYSVGHAKGNAIINNLHDIVHEMEKNIIPRIDSEIANAFKTHHNINVPRDITNPHIDTDIFINPASPSHDIRTTLVVPEIRFTSQMLINKDMY
jgi:sugar-specific transcriptional regulator TrmB